MVIGDSGIGGVGGVGGGAAGDFEGSGGGFWEAEGGRVRNL